jgi:hypothetical protein
MRGPPRACHAGRGQHTPVPRQIVQHLPKNVRRSTTAPQKTPCPITQPMRLGRGLPRQPTPPRPVPSPSEAPPIRTSSRLHPPRQNQDVLQSQPRSQAQRPNRNEYIRDPPPIGGDYARGRPPHVDSGWPPEKRQSTLLNHWGTQPIPESSSQRGSPPPPPRTQ